MTPDQIAELLMAGGMSSPAQAAVAGNDIHPYNPLLDPTGATRLGEALADRVRDLGATRVIVWEWVDNAVLGYVLASALGVPAVRAIDASGVLDLDGQICAGDKVLIVADAIRREFHLLAMRALTERHDAQVVGIATLVRTPALTADTAKEPVAVLAEETKG